MAVHKRGKLSWTYKIKPYLKYIYILVFCMATSIAYGFLHAYVILTFSPNIFYNLLDKYKIVKPKICDMISLHAFNGIILALLLGFTISWMIGVFLSLGLSASNNIGAWPSISLTYLFLAVYASFAVAEITIIFISLYKACMGDAAFLVAAKRFRFREDVLFDLYAGQLDMRSKTFLYSSFIFLRVQLFYAILVVILSILERYRLHKERERRMQLCR